MCCTGKMCSLLVIMIMAIQNITPTLSSTKYKVPPKVKIVSHFANPPLIANCTKTSLQCLVSSQSLTNVIVWWTFRGDNASLLPSAHVTKPSPNEWKLSVECATLHHSGTYACHAALVNETQRFARKEAVVQVYVAVTIRSIPSSGIVREMIGGVAVLKCDISSYPRAVVNWAKIVNYNELSPVISDERVQIVNKDVNETTQETSLIINVVSPVDNGSYVCHAKNEYNNQSETSLQLVVLQKALIRIERVEPLTARSAHIFWRVIDDGNSPIKRFILQLKNYSQHDTVSEWMLVEKHIEPSYSGSYIVHYLAPAVTYGFQLAAINSAGQSDWKTMNATLPPDLPNKISDLHVLAATNETLLIGWKRPHDNGAQISEYKMELRSESQSSIIRETMFIKEDTQETRKNYMYIFVGLEPANLYYFQVRACSYIGCGQWSAPELEAKTGDGYADPPNKVKLKCYFDAINGANYADISWHRTDNARGTIVGYNVSIVGDAKYRNSNNQFVSDPIAEWHRVNNAHQLKVPLKAHTNYTLQICTINMSGCGVWSDANDDGSKCVTGASLPHTFPLIKFEQNDLIGQLRLSLPRLSERFGVITCYRVFVIKLPFGATLSDLPHNPNDLNITSYAKVHYHQHIQPQAYIADEIDSDSFNNEVIIGDRNYSQCIRRDTKVNIELNGEEAGIVSNATNLIDDGPLAEFTNYSGFVEIHVLGNNGEILRKQSAYLSAMQTTSLPLLSMPTTTNVVSPLLSSMGNPSTTILLCLISGIAIILLIVILILWLLIRRNNDINNSSPNAERDTSERLTSLQQSKHVHSNGLTTNDCLPSIQTNNSVNQYVPLMPIHVLNLAQVYKEKMFDNNRLFELEFNSLPQSFDDRTTFASDAQQNMDKNRFASIKCYDQTRVLLSLINDEPNSDYINANFVSYGEKLYICAQGPIQSTVNDFWRMIYEYESSMIVMLTGCEEHEECECECDCKCKCGQCAQYWLDDGLKCIHNAFTVSVKSVCTYPDYTVRQFQLSTSDTSVSRDILHFHFTMWRDFSTPEMPSRILRFIKHVNENYCAHKGPLVVHCCSGVGLTGTYVAIDSLLPQINSGYVNIYDCVLNLRYQRNYLVQTLKQYIFIYRALLEFDQFGDTDL